MFLGQNRFGEGGRAQVRLSWSIEAVSALRPLPNFLQARPCEVCACEVCVCRGNPIRATIQDLRCRLLPDALAHGPNQAPTAPPTGPHMTLDGPGCCRQRSVLFHPRPNMFAPSDAPAVLPFRFTPCSKRVGNRFLSPMAENIGSHCVWPPFPELCSTTLPKPTVLE